MAERTAVCGKRVSFAYRLQCRGVYGIIIKKEVINYGYIGRFYRIRMRAVTRRLFRTLQKMFGEYMVYANDKPILLVCDNCVYVKKLPQLEKLFGNAQTGIPYAGAKEHYILDIEDAELVSEAIPLLESITPLPKKKK